MAQTRVRAALDRLVVLRSDPAKRGSDEGPRRVVLIRNRARNQRLKTFSVPACEVLLPLRGIRTTSCAGVAGNPRLKPGSTDVSSRKAGRISMSVAVGSCENPKSEIRNPKFTYSRSSTLILVSSPLALISGTYIAWPNSGRAWNWPGTSARIVYRISQTPWASRSMKRATLRSRSSR